MERLREKQEKNQSAMLRLQKERESSAQESEKLQEKIELLQAQLAKATRDRELLHNETETCRERLEKANQTLLKVQVISLEKMLKFGTFLEHF